FSANRWVFHEHTGSGRTAFASVPHEDTGARRTTSRVRIRCRPMSASFVSDKAARVRRNPWIMGLAASPFAVVLAEIVGAVVFPLPQALVLLPHMLAIGTAATIFAWRKNARPREVPGKLEAGNEGVTFAGEKLVAKEDLKSAMVLP